MKNHMLRLTLISLVTLSVFSSCKKDKDDKVAVTAENLVGNYKMVDYKIKSSTAGNVEVSMMEGISTCYKDDLYQLKAGSVLTVVDEGEKCGNDDTATWTLKDNKITLNASAWVEGTFEVISLNKNQLVLSVTETGDGDTTTYTVVFNRQ